MKFLPYVLLAKKFSTYHIENTTKKEGECQVYQVKEGECQVSVQKGSECQVTSRRRWVSSNKWKKESVKCKVKEGECQVKEVSVK